MPVLLLPGSGEVLPPTPDEVAPLVALPPLMMRSSRRHLSRSAPIRPRHLLLVAPEVLGVLVVPGRPEGPVVPDAPGVADMPGVEPLGVEPAPPYVDEPGAPLVPCASDTPDSAKSAAAVAA